MKGWLFLKKEKISEVIDGIKALQNSIEKVASRYSPNEELQKSLEDLELHTNKLCEYLSKKSSSK